MANQFCGLSIAGDGLSGLVLRQAGKGLSLVGGASLTLGEDDAEDLAPAIKNLCKTLKISRAEVTACLPKQQATVRWVLLPSTQADELAQMARFEAERHIPFHAERHCVGYHIMRSMGVEGSEVLLGAVDGPIVERTLKGVEAAGLKPRGVTLSSVCLVNSLLYTKPEWVEGKTTAIVSIGLDAVDLVLLDEERVVFARSVSMNFRSVLETWMGLHAGEDPGASRPDAARLATAARMIDCQDPADQYSGKGGAPPPQAIETMRNWLDRLVKSIRQTYDFARREMKCPPIDVVVLSGEGAVLRNLDQYLHQNLDTEMRTLNPVGALPGADRKKFPFGGNELVIPFGAAIGQTLEDGYFLDLTPRDHYRHVAHRRTMRKLARTGVMLVVTLGLFIAAYLHYNDIRERTLKAYRNINRDLKPQVAELTEMSAKMEILGTFLNDPNPALLVLNDMAHSPTVPKDVVARTLQFEKYRTLAIEGEARSIRDLTRFVQDLRETEHFALVDTDRHDEDKTSWGKEFYRYKVTCELFGEPATGASNGGRR